MRVLGKGLKRPAGFTVLAILLGVLGLGAFVLTMTAETLAEIGAKWHIVRIGALAYGLCAFVAATGLWKMRRWGYLAFVAWVGSVVLVGIWWPLVLPSGKVPWWLGLIWIGVVAIIMLPLARYIRKGFDFAGDQPGGSTST
jgi:hypothetical protein